MPNEAVRGFLSLIYITTLFIRYSKILILHFLILLSTVASEILTTAKTSSFLLLEVQLFDLTDAERGRSS
jgi:hypothetical protein